MEPALRRVFPFPYWAMWTAVVISFVVSFRGGRGGARGYDGPGFRRLPHAARLGAGFRALVWICWVILVVGATRTQSGEKPDPRSPSAEAGSPEVVGEARDVVLAEVVAALHLDEHQWFVAIVGNTMGSAHRHVDRGTCRQPERLVVERHRSGTADPEPVLGSSGVELVAEPLSRQTTMRLTLYPAPSSRTW